MSCTESFDTSYFYLYFSVCVGGGGGGGEVRGVNGGWGVSEEGGLQCSQGSSLLEYNYLHLS